MATLFVEYAPAGKLDRGGVLPVMGIPTASEKITTDATTTQGSATAGGNGVASVRASGNGVWVTFGANPTATVAGAGMIYLADGERRDIGPIDSGHIIAAIDDA